MNTRSLLLGLCLMASVVFLAACPKRVSIEDIEADPSRYSEKEVVVAGTVKDSYGVTVPGTSVRGGAFKIDDGTGSIWIITRDSVPSKGARIGVKGRVGTGVNWNGKNYGLGILENDRKILKR